MHRGREPGEKNTGGCGWRVRRMKARHLLMKKPRLLKTPGLVVAVGCGRSLTLRETSTCCIVLQGNMSTAIRICCAPRTKERASKEKSFIRGRSQRVR